jgi:hypothetical protein
VDNMQRWPWLRVQRGYPAWPASLCVSLIHALTIQAQYRLRPGVCPSVA